MSERQMYLNMQRERDAAQGLAAEHERQRVHEGKQHYTMLQRAEAAEAEVERLRRLIRADHGLKAAQGGAPCTCEVCREHLLLAQITAERDVARSARDELVRALREEIDDLNVMGYGFRADRLEVILERALSSSTSHVPSKDE